ncbi:MAG: S9 family peptidase [Alphaproteobacteria bacterium]
MRGPLLALGVLANLWCASAVAQQAAAPPSAPPPAEAYGRLPVVEDAAISPDGSHLVISVATESQTALRLYNINTRSFETTLPAPEGNKFRGVSWADNTHAVYFISRALNPHEVLPRGYGFAGDPRRVQYWRTGVVNTTNMHAQLMMIDDHAFANTNLTNLTAPIAGDPGFGRMIASAGVGVGNLSDSEPELEVFRINLDTGIALPQTHGNPDTDSFALDSRGQAVARLDVNNLSGHWRLIAMNGGADRVLEEGTTHIGVLPALEGAMHDGRIVVYDNNDEGSDEALVTFDPATAERKEIVVANDVHPQGAIVDPWTHEVVGVSWIDELPRQYFFDSTLEGIAEKLSGEFQGSYALIESWSADKSRVLVRAERSDDAGAYYVYDAAGDHLTRIALLYPELSADALGQRASITYRARDGQRVPAYLTLPVGADAHNLPLVLLVHGGPAARDTLAFDWEAAFLASRGYAVLQPNFRGSWGLGHDWWAAGQGQWGDGVMQTDVEDGVAALVRNGMVDPTRVCIMGGSYGGYSALIGAALTPNRYACAISIAGVADLDAMLDQAASASGGTRSLESDWWRTSMGASDRTHLHHVSPITHASEFHTPVLLLHGTDDTTVPVSQSQRMADALRSAGKDVRLVTFPGDDHSLADPQTRIQMLHEVEAFLDAHIGAHRPAH